MHTIAHEHHRAHPEGTSAECVETWLGALVPRVVFPGGWAAAARQAGAEPLWTGRARAYDASTLRKAAVQLDAEGGTARVARAVWRQVEHAVAAMDEPVIAHTDVFDQPFYTKRVAHAAPIGRLGNRLLAATYFGLTTVAIPRGPTLLAHLSWHKPGAPLRDALEDLFADAPRLAWWQEHVRLQILDRGANGDPVLRWLWAWEIPYLTIGRKRADLWRFRTPTERTDHDLPLVVHPDGRLAGTRDDGPWEIIVPADPDDPDATRGIRFRSAVPLDGAELRGLNALYKSRWPSMENELKALQAVGFGRNRTRAVELTTSRGTDGDLARLRDREATLLATLEAAAQEPASGTNFTQVVRVAKKVEAVRARQTVTLDAAELKYARPEGGAEWLGKWLHLLVHNALTLALYRSANADVRTMTPAHVFELLLGRPALTCIEPGQLTMTVDADDNAADRRHQEALVEVFNQLGLRGRRGTITIRLHERAIRKES